MKEEKPVHGYQANAQFRSLSARRMVKKAARRTGERTRDFIARVSLEAAKKVLQG